MKPIVLLVESMENGKITMPYEDFKQIIQEVYEQGKADAPTITTPTIPHDYWRITPTWTDKTQITCVTTEEEGK